jgi:hypothetical protein
MNEENLNKRFWEYQYKVNNWYNIKYKSINSISLSIIGKLVAIDKYKLYIYKRRCPTINGIILFNITEAVKINTRIQIIQKKYIF